jgi:hypothetical protein
VSPASPCPPLLDPESGVPPEELESAVMASAMPPLLSAAEPLSLSPPEVPLWPPPLVLPV